MIHQRDEWRQTHREVVGFNSIYDNLSRGSVCGILNNWFRLFQRQLSHFSETF